MKIVRFGLYLAFYLLLLTSFTSTTLAATSNKNSSSSNTTTNTSSSTNTSVSSSTQSNAAGIETYSSASTLQIGTIVQLVKGSTQKVAPSTQANMQQMYGVVVDPNTLPLTIADSNLTNETYVATSGTYDVLVDTQNGAISAGDYITISAVDGVAMKAGTYDQQSMVFGRAVSSFDGKSNVIDTTTLKGTSGQGNQTVQLGLIPVAINIERNPNQKSTKVNLPPFLQQLGQAIAQKPVGPERVYLSLLITGLSICVALVTLYAGVRNAMVAIGRNPLSKKSIFRGLLEVVLTGFLILIIGLFAVYLLLKL